MVSVPRGRIGGEDRPAAGATRQLHIIGIDLSLTATGVACRHGVETIDSTGHKADTLTDRHQRLLRIREHVLSWCRDADLIVIEAPSHGSSGRYGHQHDRSGLWWLTVHALYATDRTVVAVTPASRAKYATGKGTASKDEVLAAVVRRYPQPEVRNNNEADALVLAAMGHDALGQPLTSVPATHRAALTAITWPTPTGAAA